MQWKCRELSSCRGPAWGYVVEEMVVGLIEIKYSKWRMEGGR